MKFNEHQVKLWANMLYLIDKYRRGELYYSDLVYELEGCLDAGEFQDMELIGQWYEYWTPLEILSASKGDNVTIEDVNCRLMAMEIFIKGRCPFQKEE